MKTDEIKVGVSVVDRWYPEQGTGIIKEILKTRVKIDFNGEIKTYDLPHSRLFLEVVEPIKTS